MIPLDGWQQHASPVFGARLVAAPKHGVFQITELVEQKQGMIAHALEVPVVGRAFLLSIGVTDGAVHIENQFPERLALADLVDPLARKIHQRCQVAPGAENLGLEATGSAIGTGTLDRDNTGGWPWRFWRLAPRRLALEIGHHTCVLFAELGLTPVQLVGSRATDEFPQLVHHR